MGAFVPRIHVRVFIVYCSSSSREFGGYNGWKDGKASRDVVQSTKDYMSSCSQWATWITVCVVLHRSVSNRYAKLVALKR